MESATEPIWRSDERDRIIVAAIYGVSSMLIDLPLLELLWVNWTGG